MLVRFLGTGTSTGVPEIGCQCEVCTSIDQRDSRLRSSAIVETQGKRILIDCGPDFREQMLHTKFEAIDGVLLTHEHYDHVGGLDDIRPFCRFGSIKVYAQQDVSDALRSRIPYCFAEYKYPGIPDIGINTIDLNPFSIGGVEIIPIRVMHGLLPILGYRIGNLAYLTDLKFIADEELEKLKNLDVLVINALRIQEHISHENLEQALININKINPKKAYLIHMSHHIGLHASVEKILPENVYIAYDGLEIEVF